jgi:glycosyltransferase involved in cell wall biosynthesis
VDPDEVVSPSPGGGRLLCVAAVVPHKGHDLLLDALRGIAELPWTCMCAGSLDREPRFVERLRRQAAAAGIADRVRLPGPLTGGELRRAYREADLVVLPSRIEAFGMVVPEALAVGLPVVATAVGGIPEALGRTRIGVPGLLVPPDDGAALGGALGAWLRDEGLRARLRRAAVERRTCLAGWYTTARELSAVLAGVGSVPATATGRR